MPVYKYVEAICDHVREIIQGIHIVIPERLLSRGTLKFVGVEEPSGGMLPIREILQGARIVIPDNFYECVPWSLRLDGDLILEPKKFQKDDVIHLQ